MKIYNWFERCKTPDKLVTCYFKTRRCQAPPKRRGEAAHLAGAPAVRRKGAGAGPRESSRAQATAVKTTPDGPSARRARNRYTRGTLHHCSGFNFRQRREALQKPEALPRARRAGGRARPGRAPDAPRAAGEDPVPARAGGRPAAEPARTAEGGTRHRPPGRRDGLPAGAAGGSYVGTPGKAGRRPRSQALGRVPDSPGAASPQRSWVRAGAERGRRRASGAEVSARARSSWSGGGSRGRGRTRRAGRGPRAGGGATAEPASGVQGRGGAKPVASVTRAGASLSQRAPGCLIGRVTAGERGRRALGTSGGEMGQDPSAGGGGRRERDCRPRGGRKWAGARGPCPRAARGSRDCGQRGDRKWAGRGGAGGGVFARGAAL